MDSVQPITASTPLFNVTPSLDMTTEAVTVSNIHIPSHNWVFMVLLLVILCSVIGNVLVCVAIMTERALHSQTNYFLLSMAVADLMVALLVMPMALVKYLFGLWLLGPAMCNIWVSLDVLCCTSSIMHICTMSIERYLAIGNSFTIKRRSRFQTTVKIVTVWLISITLCSPIFVLGFVSTADVLNVDECILTNRLFRIYGSIIAFYIPLVIVVITYGRTAYILNKKARTFASANKHEKLSATATENMVSGRSSILYKAMMCYHQCTDTSLNECISMDIYETSRAEETEMNIMNDRTENLKPDTQTLNGSPRNLYSPGTLENPVLEMRRSTSGTSRKGYTAKIRTERRASKVLGLVFAVFVIGWTPFFVCNFFIAICGSCDINPTFFSIFEWLGWASSMFNPFIYTIFNKTFQRTFWKLITCQWIIRNKTNNKQRFKRVSIIVE